LLDILTMNLPINVKSAHNISKWQMGFNSAFKGLTGKKTMNVAADQMLSLDITYSIFLFYKQALTRP
jgi:hypothetical protein